MTFVFTAFCCKTPAQNHGKNMIQNYINWEKKQIDWWKEKLGISDHGVAWIAFIKGILVGLLIYHFFIVRYPNF